MLIYSGKYGTAAKPTFAMLSDCGWYVEVKGARAFNSEVLVSLLPARPPEFGTHFLSISF